MSPFFRNSTAFAVASYIASGLQHGDMYSGAMGTESGNESKNERPFALIRLDAEAAAERGSFCLDGGPGAYYYREGPIKNKWVLSFQSGSTWCKDLETCAKLASLGSDAPDHAAGNDLSIFRKNPFSNYSHVVFHHCDGGLGLGNRAEPVSVDGQLIYMRGRRIIDHTIDHLMWKFDFGSAEEVLVTGASGGGHSTYILADYLAWRMPRSVKKFGAVPMNGWWPQKDRAATGGYILHNMTSAIAPDCRKALPDEDRWQCLHTDISYEFTRAPMFPMQLLDYRFVSTEGPKQAAQAWNACMFNDKQECPKEYVDVLSELLDDVVRDFEQSAKFSKQDEGGFVSTCTKHTFYRQSEFFHYARGGVSAAAALTEWWLNLGKADNNKWYLPCTLNAEFPHQCERSCDYGLNGDEAPTDDGSLLPDDGFQMHGDGWLNIDFNATSIKY